MIEMGKGEISFEVVPTDVVRVVRGVGRRGGRGVVVFVGWLRSVGVVGSGG